MQKWSALFFSSTEETRDAWLGIKSGICFKDCSAHHGGDTPSKSTIGEANLEAVEESRERTQCCAPQGLERCGSLDVSDKHGTEWTSSPGVPIYGPVGGLLTTFHLRG